MKKVMHPNALKILVIVVLVLLALMIATSSGSGAFLSNIFGFLTTPVQKMSTSVTDGVAEFIDLDALTTDELKARVQELTAENDALKKEMVEYYNLQQENEQLRSQLNIQEERPEYELQSAAVIMRDPNDLFMGFSIDKGYLAGISPGDPVMTDSGLVGQIKDVYATTSTVVTIFSEDLKISAFSKLHDESGVLSSDLIMAGSGTLRLNDLPSNTKITEKTIITTSGASGMYPKDLVIGYVVEVRQSDYDVSKYAIVKPYTDIKGVKNVTVITGFPGKDEEMPEMDLGGDAGTHEDTEANQ